MGDDQFAVAVPAGDELLSRLRAGDADAFAEIVRSWSPAMLRIARSFVSSDATAQEVVQETWLAVVQGLARFEGRSSLRTWTLSILANVGRRRGARDSRVVPLSALELGTDHPLVDPDRFRGPEDPWAGGWKADAWPQDWGPEAQVLNAEVRTLIARAMAELPARQRDVLALRDIHDLDTEEVAELLGISVGNVRVLLHRARVRLRNLLEDYYRGAGTMPEVAG